MSWNRKRLEKANLYLILDTQVLSYAQLLTILKPAVRFGVDIVQLRDKNGTAKDILSFYKQARKITAGRTLFILNDRVDLAMLSKSDGVHLGQDDIPYKQARAMLGPKAIIGLSCQSIQHARQAEQWKVDYIGFGSVFKTLTKPERQPMELEKLKDVLKRITIPVFPIGGINAENLEPLTKIGVTRAAVCRDILMARDVAGRVKKYKEILNTKA